MDIYLCHDLIINNIYNICTCIYVCIYIFIYMYNIYIYLFSNSFVNQKQLTY